MWTIIRFLTRFFQDIWHATIFAVLEYDDQLKLTKTTNERVIIWLMVAALTVVALVILVMFIRSGLDAINIPIP